MSVLPDAWLRDLERRRAALTQSSGWQLEPPWTAAVSDEPLSAAGDDRTFAPFRRASSSVMIGAMSPEALANPIASTQKFEPAHAITYLVSATEAGDLETGAVLLDGRPMGRLSRRRRPGVVPQHSDGPLLAADSVWHAEAVGWLPYEGRPWDTRVTSSAPTRRRAAEDLLRSYRNHR